MGIYDRDYYQAQQGGRAPPFVLFRSAVATLIVANAVVWLLEIGVGKKLTYSLAASGEDVFRFQIWKVFTANFVHSPNSIWHLVVNMLFLYFLGRDLEQIYERRDFYTLYVGAGMLAVFTQVAFLHFTGRDGDMVFGASGAVMAVVVLFTLFYPQRMIYVFIVPLPAWALCALFLIQDLSGVLHGSNEGVANLAHLTGGGVGFLYRYFDLRWSRLGGGFFRRQAGPSRRRKIIDMESARQHRKLESERDLVSRRIDDLLKKIHEKQELTEDELKFLKENSGRYRSR